MSFMSRLPAPLLTAAIRSLMVRPASIVADVELFGARTTPELPSKTFTCCACEADAKAKAVKTTTKIIVFLI
jgi:hypothetical protein